MEDWRHARKWNEGRRIDMRSRNAFGAPRSDRNKRCLMGKKKRKKEGTYKLAEFSEKGVGQGRGAREKCKLCV